jgi:hypothetical protein
MFPYEWREFSFCSNLDAFKIGYTTVSKPNWSCEVIQGLSVKSFAISYEILFTY